MKQLYYVKAEAFIIYEAEAGTPAAEVEKSVQAQIEKGELFTLSHVTKVSTTFEKVRNAG